MKSFISSSFSLGCNDWNTISIGQKERPEEKITIVYVGLYLKPDADNTASKTIRLWKFWLCSYLQCHQLIPNIDIFLDRINCQLYYKVDFITRMILTWYSPLLHISIRIIIIFSLLKLVWNGFDNNKNPKWALKKQLS